MKSLLEKRLSCCCGRKSLYFPLGNKITGLTLRCKLQVLLCSCQWTCLHRCAHRFLSVCVCVSVIVLCQNGGWEWIFLWRDGRSSSSGGCFFFFCLGNVTLRDCWIDRLSTVDLWTTELRGEVLRKTWNRCKELLWKPPKHQAKLWAVAPARGFGVDAAVAQILTVFSQWDQQRRLCVGTFQHTDTLKPAACVCLCFNWTWTNWTASFFFYY